MMPCSLVEVHQLFRQRCWCHHEALVYTLTIKAEDSSETSLHFYRLHVSDPRRYQCSCHRRGNLKFTPYFTSCNTRAQEKRTCGIIVWNELPQHPQPDNRFCFFLFPGLEYTGIYCLTRTRQYIWRLRVWLKRNTGGNMQVSIFVLSVITIHVSWCNS
jgi:hypothetical protein